MLNGKAVIDMSETERDRCDAAYRGLGEADLGVISDGRRSP